MKKYGTYEEKANRRFPVGYTIVLTVAELAAARRILMRQSLGLPTKNSIEKRDLSCHICYTDLRQEG